MDRLSEILPKVAGKRGLQKHVAASLAIHNANLWIKQHVPHLEGDLVARTLQEDGTLLLECAHSAAAQESQQHLPHLALYLREDCGYAGVRTVRVIRARPH